MFGRRGQGAMEYLMTYGWAILVVMVVGIVMWQLGIFNIGGTTVTSTGFAKLKPQLSATGSSAGGTFSAIFTNGAGTLIDMTTGAVIREIGTSTCSAVTFTPRKGIAGGANFQVGATGCPMGVPGDIYNLQVSIPYIVSVGGITTDHAETGTIRGPME
jgi:hypothetical protein